ncbi:hypothetical protein Tco_0003903 [Tanacetum coccineum]
MLRAFSLFLLALAASEVFGADEDVGSVVAWSPLVINPIEYDHDSNNCRIFMDQRSYSPFLIIGILSAVTDEVGGIGFTVKTSFKRFVKILRMY